jgi:hypothetical protein
VIAHGFVPSLVDIWAACDVMICPIHAGGGVSVKLAEIVYNGVPVVATSFAARGLPLEPHPSIVLLDGAEGWIRFLRSRDADALHRCRGPAPAAKAFAIDAHVARVHELVHRVVRESSA